MGREPNDRARADRAPRVRYGDVVLADVNPIRAGADREVWAVVDDQERAVIATGARIPRSRRQDLVVIGVLHPKLDDVDPARERAPQGRVRQLVTHEVEPSIGEALPDRVGHRPQSATLRGPEGLLKPGGKEAAIASAHR